MKFMLIVWAAFLARQSPVSTSANPACMNMTRKPVISVQIMLMEKRLWTIRSYRSLVPRDAGVSPFPSLAGPAHTPAEPPVGSGQVGLLGSVFAPEKYGGKAGAGAAAGPPAPAGVSSARRGPDAAKIHA